MHNLCVFCTFSTFAQKIFKGWGCNFTWSFGKVMRIKSLKMVFVARIIRHKLCMIYAFLELFCSKKFWPKLFSYCWDKFDYTGSIVYFWSGDITLLLDPPPPLSHFVTILLDPSPPSCWMVPQESLITLMVKEHSLNSNRACVLH